jgi:hypothetical protein
MNRLCNARAKEREEGEPDHKQRQDKQQQPDRRTQEDPHGANLPASSYPVNWKPPPGRQKPSFRAVPTRRSVFFCPLTPLRKPTSRLPLATGNGTVGL